LYLCYVNALRYFDYFNVNVYIHIRGSAYLLYPVISRVSYPSNGRSRARLEARKFMNEETAGIAKEHSFCNVCFPDRQNEPFGDIRTRVGDSLLRGIASAALELVSSELDVQSIFTQNPRRREFIPWRFARLCSRVFSCALPKIFPHQETCMCDQIFYINSVSIDRIFIHGY